MKFPSGQSPDTNTVESNSMDSPSSATRVVVALTSFPLIFPARELIVLDSTVSLEQAQLLSELRVQHGPGSPLCRVARERMLRRTRP